MAVGGILRYFNSPEVSDKNHVEHSTWKFRYSKICGMMLSEANHY